MLFFNTQKSRLVIIAYIIITMTIILLEFFFITITMILLEKKIEIKYRLVRHSNPTCLVAWFQTKLAVM